MKKPSCWYKINAAHEDGEEAEILIYDDIGRNFWGEGIAAEDLVKELASLDVAELSVRINSAGGQVFEGLAIYNALDRHPANVTTHVDGMAASIASIVALAGDEVRIAENAFMMIHNPFGVQFGDANAMRKMADILDGVTGSLSDIYVAKSGTSEKKMRAMMDDETWFNSAEALEAGLVDEVEEELAVAASFDFDFSRFKNVRDDVQERAERAQPSGFFPKPGAGIESITPAIEAGLEAVAAAEEEGPTEAELLQLAADSARTLSATRLF